METVGELVRKRVVDVGVVEIGRNNHGTRVHVDEEKPSVAEEGLGERGGRWNTVPMRFSLSK